MRTAVGQWNSTGGAVAVVRVTATDTSPTIVGTEGPNNPKFRVLAQRLGWDQLQPAH